MSPAISQARKSASANKVVEKRKRTKLSKKVFRRSKLESDFASFCQAIFADRAALVQMPESTWVEVEFINNEAFGSTQAEKVFLGDALFSTCELAEAKKAGKLPDLPVHLARLCETRLLRPEQERELFQRLNYLRFRAEKLRTEIKKGSGDEVQAQKFVGLIKAGDWYRDAIVKANMRLVISIVKKFVNNNNQFDDLLSDGIVALMRAVDKFDYDRGFRFSTYATQVVRRNAYRTVMQRQKERQQVATSLHESGIDVSDEIREPTMSEGRWHSLRGRLAMMLDSLDRREKLIIRARFSLGSHRNVKTLQCLADRLGVSKERVRQLEKRSLDKLRDMVQLTPIVDEDDTTE